jgi:hypothetical protein
MSSGEVRQGVQQEIRQGVQQEIHRDRRRRRPIARRAAVSGRPEKLRSPRHIEVDS